MTKNSPLKGEALLFFLLLSLDAHVKQIQGFGSRAAACM